MHLVMIEMFQKKEKKIATIRAYYELSWRYIQIVQNIPNDSSLIFDVTYFRDKNLNTRIIPNGFFLSTSSSYIHCTMNWDSTI